MAAAAAAAATRAREHRTRPPPSPARTRTARSHSGHAPRTAPRPRPAPAGRWAARMPRLPSRACRSTRLARRGRASPPRMRGRRPLARGCVGTCRARSQGRADAPRTRTCRARTGRGPYRRSGARLRPPRDMCPRHSRPPAIRRGTCSYRAGSGRYRGSRRTCPEHTRRPASPQSIGTRTWSSCPRTWPRRRPCAPRSALRCTRLGRCSHRTRPPRTWCRATPPHTHSGGRRRPGCSRCRLSRTCRARRRGQRKGRRRSHRRPSPGRRRTRPRRPRAQRAARAA